MTRNYIVHDLHIYSFDNDTMIAIKSENNLGEKKGRGCGEGQAWIATADSALCDI